MSIYTRVARFLDASKQNSSLWSTTLIAAILMSVFGGTAVQAAAPAATTATAATTTPVAVRSLKIGVVDVEKVYNNYDKAKASGEEIRQKRVEQEIILAKKQAELKELTTSYQEKAETMKEAEKQALQKKIRDLTAEIVTYGRLAGQQLSEANKEQMQARLKEIAAAVQKYAKENNYDLIMDEKSLLFFIESLDISDAVIAALKKG